MQFDDPERLSCIRRTHVMVLPEGRGRGFVAEPDEHFSSLERFDVNMRRLVFPRRRVYVDAEATPIMDLHHERR